MPSTIQRTFAAGEIAPELHARADLARYQNGLKTCRNCYVQRFGGVTNRPGTQLVVEVKDSSKATRLLKFVFSDDQTYVLEFGDQYMRIVRDGGQVVVSGVVAWVTATAYVLGDVRSRGGTNYYCKLAHTSGAGSEPGVGASWTTYWSAMTGSVYEIPTPYAEADLFGLHFMQTGDVLTITHPDYEPYELQRTGHTTWALIEIEFGTQLDAPAGLSAVAGAAGSIVYRYAVTSVDADGRESVAGEGTAITATITGIAKVATAVGLDVEYRARITTSAGHGLTSGDDVLITGVVGMDELNGKRFRVTVRSATTFDLRSLDVTSYGTYSSGGTVTGSLSSVSSAAPTQTDPNVLTWTAVDDAREYNIYREYGGVFGYIGTATANSFDDIGYVPDTTVTPPIDKSYFEGADDFPATTGFFQQRRLFGASNNEPETGWASRIGDSKNFTARDVVQDDDAFKFTPSGHSVQRIRHFVDLGRLVLLTENGEFIVEGGSDGVLKPTAVNLRQQSYVGASTIRPLPIGSSALFVQSRGSAVFDLAYQLDIDGYRGNEVSITAAHLFDGYEIVDWDYQKRPHSLVWMVRDDGTLIGLTYVRDQQVFAFHHHDTGDGDEFESVVCVPEGDEDAVYVVVKRTINGSTKRYIERFATRTVTDIAVDAIFLDSSLTYDGRNSGAVTMTLTGGTTWVYTETLTLTASAATFVAEDGTTRSAFTASDVGAAFVLRTGSDSIRVVVTAYTDPTHVSVQPVATVPASLRAVATSDWDKAIKVVTGLAHLQGRTVAALADGSTSTGLTVASGQVTLPRAAAVIHVGLGYESDLETLDLESINTETLSDKRKRVNRVTLKVKDTRGLEVGDSEDSTLRAPTPLWATVVSDPMPLHTGLYEVLPQATWNDHGRVFIRQSEPLPMTILAITPSGVTGG